MPAAGLAGPDLDVVARSGLSHRGPPRAAMTSMISVDAQARGVDEERVLGLDERRDLPALVQGVSSGEVGRDRLVVEVGHLLRATLGPHLGVGGQVHLELGVREDDGADVAALEHSAVARRHPLPLPANHLRPHRRVGGHDAHGPADLGPADLDGGVDAVDRHPVGPDLQLDVGDDPSDLFGLRWVDAAAQGGEGDRAVHRAGVEVLEVQADRRAPAPRWTCPTRPGRRWR